MAFNVIDLARDDYQDLGGISGLFRTAIGLTPIALGAYVGIKNVHQNEGLNNPLKTVKQNTSQVLGREIGVQARRKRKDLAKAALDMREEISKAVRDKGVVNQLTQRLRDHTTLAHTLSVTIEDPALGLNTTQVQALKDKLRSLASSAEPDEEFVRRTIDTIVETASDEGILKFRQNLETYSKLSSKIVPINHEVLKRGQSYTTIDSARTARERIMGSSLSGADKEAASGLVDQVLGHFGKDSKVRFAHMQEGGIDAFYAQIYRGDRWQGNIALNPTGTFRQGQTFNTLYATPRGGIDARQALNFLQGIPSRKRPDMTLKGALIGQGAMYGFGQLQMRIWEDDTLTFAEKRAKLASYMQVVPRASQVHFPPGSPLANMSRHIRFQTQSQQNVYQLMEIGSLGDQGPELVARLSAMEHEGFTVNRKGMISGFGDDRQAFVGVAGGSGSVFENWQRTYGMTREHLPITAREFQIAGRTDMFTNPIRRHEVGGRSLIFGGLGRLSDKEMMNQSAGLGRFASGALSAMAIIQFDDGSDAYRAMSGQGQGIATMAFDVAKPTDLSVFTPETGTTSVHLKRILESRGTPVRFDWKDHQDGIYLGEDASGPRILRPMQGETEVFIQLDRHSETHGKAMEHLTVIRRRKQDVAAKLFSGSAKGMAVVGTEELVRQNLREHALVVDKVVKGVGLDLQNAIMFTDDYFSKGTGTIARASALMAETWGGISVDSVRREAERLQLSAASLGKSGGRNNPIELALRYSLASASLLAKTNAPRQAAGMALVGIHKRLDKYVSDPKQKAAIRQEIFSVLKTLGPDAEEGFRSGIMMYREAFVSGTGVGDWGKGRGSFEPRMAKGLMSNLMQAGVSVESASKLIAGIYKRSVGMTNKLEFASSLLRMSTSVRGTQSMSEIRKLQGMKTLSYQDLLDLHTTDSRDGLINLARSQEHGVLIDTSDAPDHVKHAIRQTTRSGEIVVPGRQAFESTKGVLLKQSGNQSIELGGAYEKLLRGLSGTLTEMSQMTEGGAEKYSAWAGQLDKLTGDVFTNITRGKVAGSAYYTSLHNTTNFLGILNQRQQSKFRQLARQTALSGEFVSSEGFLSQLLDMRDEGRFDRKHLAKQMETFFTEMEFSKAQSGKARTSRGILGVTLRNPALSPSNVWLTQTFRDLREVSALGGQDAVFQRIKETEVGRQMLTEAFGADAAQGIRSFQDMLPDKHRTARKKFFHSFVRNLEHFTSGEGGGIATTMRELIFGQDLGAGAGSYLDQDGDQVLKILFDAKQSSIIKGKYNDINSVEARLFMNEITTQVGEGISNYGAGIQKTLSGTAEDVLKEVGLDIGTGKLDVALRPIHDAAFDYSPGSRESAQLRGFLGAVQELAIIKAKKLPAYTKLPDILVGAFSHAMQTGDMSELDMVIKKDLLAGTALGRGEQITIDLAEMARRQGGDQAADIATSLGLGHRTTFNIDDMLRHTGNLIREARSRGTHHSMTAGQIASRLKKTPDSVIDALATGTDINSSVLRGYEGDTLESVAASTRRTITSVKDSMAKFDRRLMGPLSLGFVGAVGASMLVGQQGYGPTPITVPGEVQSTRVNQAMSQGNLFSFDDRTAQVSQEDHKTAEMALLDRQINTGTTYVQHPNAYQVRGEMYSGHGMMSLNTYMNNAGLGSGQINIRDHRRPITSSYVDRLMGEY